MIKSNSSIQIFLAPILWTIIFIVFIVLGNLILGSGPPSGALMGIIYAFFIAPFIGIFGIIYAIKSFTKQSTSKTYLSLAMNMSLILSGILVWLTWFDYI